MERYTVCINECVSIAVLFVKVYVLVMKSQWVYIVMDSYFVYFTDIISWHFGCEFKELHQIHIGCIAFNSMKTKINEKKKTKCKDYWMSSLRKCGKLERIENDSSFILCMHCSLHSKH